MKIYAKWLHFCDSKIRSFRTHLN